MNLTIIQITLIEIPINTYRSTLHAVSGTKNVLEYTCLFGFHLSMFVGVIVGVIMPRYLDALLVLLLVYLLQISPYHTPSFSANPDEYENFKCGTINHKHIIEKL